MKWEKLISFYQGLLWNEFIVVDTINPWNIWGFGLGADIDYFNKKDQGYILDKNRLDISGNAITSMSIDEDNRIWLATYHNIYVWDRIGLTPVVFKPEITGAIGGTGRIIVDHNGVKWVGSVGSLLRYDNISWNSYPFQKLSEFDNPTALAVDEKGDVWMGRGDSAGGNGYGLWRFHPTITAVNEGASLPQALKIIGNSPNPFNPSTTISYSLSSIMHTDLSIYSFTGQKVRTLVSGNQIPGTHLVVWDGQDDFGKTVSSGVYISRLTAGIHSATGKMLLLR